MDRYFFPLSLDATAARRNYEINLTGDSIYLLSGLSGLALEIRVDSTTAKPIALNEFGAVRFDRPFHKVFVTHAAIAGTFSLGLGLGVDMKPGPIRGVTIGEVDQGIAGASPWLVTDAQVHTDLLVLQRNAFGSGAAFGEELASSGAGSTDTALVNGTLGRNARYGHVQANPDNVGRVTVEVRHNGAAAFVTVAWLEPGASFALDGLDVYGVRCTFEGAAPDSALVGAW